MTDPAKIIEMKQPEKKAKILRPKIEAISPTMIVDVWRLVERSLQDGAQNYPDTTEDEPEVIRSHLFTALQNPLFAGLIAKVGKRPIGIILSQIVHRAYGRPSRYAQVWNLWIDPGFRKSGVGKLLWSEYSSRLKKAGVFHWEGQMSEKLFQELQKENGIPVENLVLIAGGRL